MYRRRSITFPVAALASLVFAATAVAGGWATVTISDPPAEPTAGSTTDLDLTVLQHGVTPVSWLAITVVATNAETGATVAEQAKPSGPTGHYTVSLTFPTEGSWTISYASKDLVMEGGQDLAVAAPTVIATSSSAAASPVVDGAMVAVLLVLVVGFIGAFAIMVVHDRRKDRPALRPETSNVPPITG
jgi:hypothetical protein